jgi:tight adherence protein C
MNVLLLIIGVLLIGATAWLMARAVALPRLRMDTHVSQIEGYGVERVSDEVESPTPQGALDRSFGRLAQRIGRRMISQFPSVSPIRQGQLAAAGFYSTSPEAVQGYRLLAASGLPAIALCYAAVLSGGLSLVTVLIMVAAAAIGWEGPVLVVRQRGRERLRKIDKELPELIDLLVATVEAGLGLGGALRLVSDRFQGPLGDELRLTQHQQGLGISNEIALNELVERADTPSVRSFARTLVRAETMGGSVGPIMRNLATDMRRRRRQAAQEQVQKTPIKLLFPLILLIFPALFIVLMYPAGYTILHQLGGGS